ncbi:AAA family ATPase [Salinisphaera sp. Q1T1-3]|uniref:AAA family ATPase n=1 Tax=Salinisphaera sp. Q1T1-3 TaxID=2321229 RepID=UPI000E71E0DA|nr:AAA family ATPase [Salinisphaera sp. Q1T1-3]RJS95119.1 VWA domain-containing protein [Salinisphaera sp. Q1T1-3]
MNDTLLPFSGVVGQSSLKTALILAAIEPRLAGVLISGPRGVAKSTLARGLAALDRQAEGRFVTLPLGADMPQVVGTLNLSQALGAGEVAFEPGLIAAAHGGYLYIDEVNLLADPLVDVLLDVAASRINRVARDGIVHAHPAEFVLIGTMNPDEGTLRPQFSDRFGLCVELEAAPSAAERRAIVDARLAFEADPAGFADAHRTAETRLADAIEAARTRLTEVAVPDAACDTIARRSAAADVEGVRADIHWRQAARAHAAWRAHDTVTSVDVDAVAEFVLCHRRGPGARPTDDADDASPDRDGGRNSGSNDAPETGQAGHDDSPVSRDRDDDADAGTGDWGGMPPRHVGAAAPVTLAREWTRPSRRAPMPRHASAPTASRLANGRVPAMRAFGTHSRDTGAGVDWFTTLMHRATTGARDESPCFRQPQPRRQLFECVLLDMSASTLAHGGQARARAVVAAINQAAHRARSWAGVMVFRGRQCDWLVTPGRARASIDGCLDSASAGGGTPLSAALTEARDRIEQQCRRAPELSVRTWLITDGRARLDPTPTRWPWELIVVDSELTRVRLGGARRLAASLGGVCVTLDDVAGCAR